MKLISENSGKTILSKRLISMNANVDSSSTGLSPAIEQLLADLIEAAKNCFQAELKSVVLFGSGAEGRLRVTSDLNLLFLLHKFEKSQVDAFRESLRVAQVAGNASVMFVLETELPLAAEAFAVKFDDIGRRHRVLFGDDVIAALAISRAAKIHHLQQVLLNLSLRLRERYVAVSLREEQLAGVIADMSGPLRAAAATLLELEGQPVGSPKEALEKIAQAVKDPQSTPVGNQLTEARQTHALPPGTAGPLMFQLMALAEAMHSRAERLK
jgi:predicted nucleotidyltransferase